MNSLQKTFLSMIRAALWDSPFKCENGVMPADLFSEACRYEITGVLSSKLDSFCKGDADTRAKWSKKALADYRKSSYVLSAQVDLNIVLSAAGVKPIILKGIASAYYYPNPLLRQIGDVDFIIPPEQFDTCCKLLEMNGYARDLDIKRHLSFEKNNIEYECHRYFSNNKTEADRLEDRIIYEGCRNCITRSVESREYYALPDAEYGIVLLEHLKHHLIEGVGFRQIMDWVVYVDAVLDDKFWNISFKEMARECELEQLAMTMTAMAQMYLGLKTEDINWCRGIDVSVCTALIEMIFSCNNFGFADENTHIMWNITRIGFFTNLNTSALTFMPLAKKIVILRPIAWAYQLTRWGIKGMVVLLRSYKQIDSSSRNFSPKKLKNQKELLRQIGVEC